MRKAYSALVGLIDDYRAALTIETSDPSTQNLAAENQREVNMWAVYQDMSMHWAKTLTVISQRLDGYRGQTSAQIDTAGKIIGDAKRAMPIHGSSRPIGHSRALESRH